MQLIELKKIEMQIDREGIENILINMISILFFLKRYRFKKDNCPCLFTREWVQCILVWIIQVMTMTYGI